MLCRRKLPASGGAALGWRWSPWQHFGIGALFQRCSFDGGVGWVGTPGLPAQSHHSAGSNGIFGKGRSTVVRLIWVDSNGQFPWAGDSSSCSGIITFRFRGIVTDGPPTCHGAYYGTFVGRIAKTTCLGLPLGRISGTCNGKVNGKAHQFSCCYGMLLPAYQGTPCESRTNRKPAALLNSPRCGGIFFAIGNFAVQLLL